MPGYQLIERAVLEPWKPNGITPLENEIGILDFLRDLAEDELPYPRFHQMRVVGLEEVLLAARPDEASLALEIKLRLQGAASDLERRMISVQVVFHGTLMHGASLWVDYRGQRLPIDHIFGSPMPESDGRNNRFFRTNFALT